MIFMNILNDSLLAERSGDRMLEGEKFPAHSQTSPGAHPDSCREGTACKEGTACTEGTSLFPRGKAAGAWR
jgi:hypothetical protein